MKPPSRAIQYFTNENLEYGKKLSKAQIVEFLEDYRLLFAVPVQKTTTSIAISIRIPEELLSAFKSKCKLKGILSYQVKIKELMSRWLEE